MPTVTINYTANFLGDHRICYRQVGTTNYCCLIDTVVALGPQSFIIDFSIPADYCFGTGDQVVIPVQSDCESYDYEGYIQPICEPLGSPNGRTLWTASFEATCLSYDISCISTGVSEILITSQGVGYIAVPTVVISGGGGSGATASAFMSISNVFLGNPGINYSIGDILVIFGGTGTAGQVAVTTIGGGGDITSVVILSAGLYSVLPGISNVPVTGGTGTGATFTLAYSLVSVIVNTTGSGYTSVPSVTFVGIAINSAQGDAVMNPCGLFSAPRCGAFAIDGVIQTEPYPGIDINMGFLESTVFCTEQGLPDIPGYDIRPNIEVLCCSCVLLTISIDTEDIVPYVYYTDAITHDFMYYNNGYSGYTGSITIVTNVNAVQDSWGIAPGFEGVVTFTFVPCL